MLDVLMAAAVSLADFQATDIDGKARRLAAYQGKVVLIANTASRCGFTPQYEALQALYARYQKRGFVVLGFPSNDFLNQEPGTSAEIAAFCDREYGVTFPMFEKVVVKGKGQHPLFGWLTGASPDKGDVKWNFEKFLLDRQGHVVGRWRSTTRPDAPEVVKAIEQAL